jgi:hypothetical protein
MVHNQPVRTKEVRNEDVGEIVLMFVRLKRVECLGESESGRPRMMRNR